MDLERDWEKMAEAVAPLLRHLLAGPKKAEVFRKFEKEGVHVLPVHFYQPVPDTAELPVTDFASRSEMIGVDLHVDRQFALLRLLGRYAAEVDSLPRAPTGVAHEFHMDNSAFSGTDAYVLHGFIRHFRPKRVIEVGSGYSSRITANAGAANGGMELTCIEPYPAPFLVSGFAGLTTLIKQPVQQVDLAIFNALEENDILFIDSTHIVRSGSDVNYLLLEVVPRLNDGVIVHVHDIFLPNEFPGSWQREQLLFWNEQYLLHALLAFNSDFEVVCMNHFLGAYYRGAMQEAFPNSPWWGGGSFWFRRKSRQPFLSA